MKQKAQKRFGETIEENAALAKATLLDPRFKKKGFSKDVYYQRAYQKMLFISRVSDRRNRLTVKNTEFLMFLNGNL